MRRLFVIVLAVLVLVACGGESTTSTPTPEPTATPVATAGAEEGSNMDANGPKQWSSPPPMQLKEGVDYQATLHTSKGDIVIDLFEQETPQTVNSFVFLAREGFYNGVTFHRVIEGFMIQTGDPTGTGAGGPGYEFDDEPFTRDYTPGTVAMANHGPNTNGSQFFIVQADLRGRLPKDYTIFGEVTQGMDVVDAIAAVEKTYNPRMGEQSAPVEPIYIESVEIVEK